MGITVYFGVSCLRSSEEFGGENGLAGNVSRRHVAKSRACQSSCATTAVALPHENKVSQITSVLPTRQQADAWRVCHFLTPAQASAHPNSGAGGGRSGRHHPWPRAG